MLISQKLLLVFIPRLDHVASTMEHEKSVNVTQSENTEDVKKPFKRQLVWSNVIFYIVTHIGAVYGLYLVVTSRSQLYTFAWAYFLLFLAGQGITMGVHRLYSHRSYKATWIVRFFLVIFQTLASQHSVWVWVRDHRQHHRFSDTDGDPHNANRGFFFSHVGWLMSRKHPDVIEKGKSPDLSDIEADPIVMFQKRHYFKIFFIVSVLIPTLVPYYYWNESLWNSFFVSTVLRGICVLHFTCLVNSAAHAYGNRPYTKNIVAVENPVVSALTYGEGWHNYHHTFPFDYRASEYGQHINVTTAIIDFLSQFGLTYDLKTVTPEMVTNRIVKRGDGTHSKLEEQSKKFETMKNISVKDDVVILKSASKVLGT